MAEVGPSRRPTASSLGSRVTPQTQTRAAPRYVAEIATVTATEILTTAGLAVGGRGRPFDKSHLLRRPGRRQVSVARRNSNPSNGIPLRPRKRGESDSERVAPDKYRIHAPWGRLIVFYFLASRVFLPRLLLPLTSLVKVLGHPHIIENEPELPQHHVLFQEPRIGIHWRRPAAAATTIRWTTTTTVRWTATSAIQPTRPAPRFATMVRRVGR
jgi:hypothetical protein